MNELTYADRLTLAIDSVVVTRLVTIFESIEEMNRAEDVPFYNSLGETLSFMMSDEDLDTLATRTVSPEWLATVAAHVD